MSSSWAAGKRVDIDINDSLENCGVTKFSREQIKVWMEIKPPAAAEKSQWFLSIDGKNLPAIIIFEVQKNGFYATLEDFERKAKKKIHKTTIERIKAVLSSDEYYWKVLSFYNVADDDQKEKDATTTPEIAVSGGYLGEEDEKQRQAAQEQAEREMEEAYASSASDPDYEDEGLPLLTVSRVIRKDPGRYRVTGIIDTIRPPFSMLKQVFFICHNEKMNCPRRGIAYREVKNLDTPIFSEQELFMAFDGGEAELAQHRMCPVCRQWREVAASPLHFETAKIVEIKNLENGGGGTNDSRHLEHLTALVFGKHTLSIGLGEEVEIIGDTYALPSEVFSSRRGNRSRSSSSAAASHNYMPIGKYYKILYVKKLKYTKRERELTITPRDVEAIKKFASYPNLVKRLVSMFAPDVYGHDDAKLGILLASVGAAPIQRDNYYRRHWMNLGLIGDQGTAKTTLGEHATKLLPGSRSVSGQHSTGKGVTAIAEKDPDGSAVLRAGAATLANNAFCFIDELGTMHREDQDQFLSLMEKGYFDFNKLGIRQRIEARTSFIVSSNPININWEYADRISKGEIPFKLTLIDRLDMMFVFREPQGDQEIDDFGDKMHELSKKHFRLDFLKLRKHIQYARTNEQLKEVSFDNEDIAELLRDTWKQIKKANPKLMSNRGYEYIFKLAKALARLKLQNIVDLQIAKETTDYVKSMYEAYGVHIGETVDRQRDAYLAICKVIKDWSLGVYSLPGCEEQQDLDVSFYEALWLAYLKDDKVKEYLGYNLNLQARNSRRVRNLHDMFSEQERDYDGGIIKPVSRVAPIGLKLRWIPNHKPDLNQLPLQTDFSAGHCDIVTGGSCDVQSKIFHDISGTRCEQSDKNYTAITEKSHVTMSQCSTPQSDSNSNNNGNGKDRQELKGLPNLKCIYCSSYYTPIRFDMCLHLYEKHRLDVVYKFPDHFVRQMKMDDRMDRILDMMESDAVRVGRYF
jgi:DNA replicative helicase MCM subunit Mcm2 (Cdc46/Mcm family)